MMRSRFLFLGLLFGLAACGPERNGGFGTPDASMNGMDGGGGSCRSNADCDDNTPCTRDLCLVGGVCERTPDNSMCPMGQMCISGRGCSTGGSTRTCMTQMDCDDRIPCTRDRCLVEGVCQNTPMDTMCTGGQRCDPMRGCTSMVSRCMSNTDCDDTVACTEDTCLADGTCSHVPQNSRCPRTQTCNSTMGCIVERACENNMQCDDMVYCNGAERCSGELACVAGTPIDCNDNDPCTRDSCNEMTRSCTHMRDTACNGTMVRSGLYNVTPAPSMMCRDLFLGQVALNFNVRMLQFTVTPSGLTVTGAPATMMGPPPMGASFDVQGVVAGDCPETYRLMGTFTDATHFTGTFSLRLGPSPTCALVDCRDMSWPVSGAAG